MKTIAWQTLLCCALLAGAAVAQAPSPYAGQESRDIKALSPQEIADLTAGRGMGLAKAAELNGYPGPAHVLEMGAALDLTADQRKQTEALFAKMQARAIAVGSELIDEERALDAKFAAHTVSADELARSLARIATLQRDLREVHLHAHLDQNALLTPAQIAHYNELRGYATSSGEAHSHMHH